MLHALRYLAPYWKCEYGVREAGERDGDFLEVRHR